jgi:hypothetical protein
MPFRRKTKETGLPQLKVIVQEKLKIIFKNMPWVNTSVDLVTDAAVRLFNGYIAQELDNNWEFRTFPIEFESITSLK